MHAAEQAWAQRMSDPDASWAFVHLHAGRSQAAVLRAYLRWREGRHMEAMEDVSTVESWLRAERHWGWLARALNLKGAVLLDMGQSLQALTLFQEQLTLAQQAGDAEMIALAHNDIGVQLVWDDPERARLRFQMAFEVARDAGPEHQATMGLAAFNLSVVEKELGQMDLSARLLEVAEDHVSAARAWPYWAGVVSQRALRLAEAGEIDLARRHFEAALARTLPVESRRFLTFHLAKLEAQYGAPSAALTGLAELQSWSTTRVDMLDDVLQVQAAAQARLGDYHSAYHTLLNMVQAIQIRHDEELSVQLKVVEAVHRTEETRRNAEALLHRQGAG